MPISESYKERLSAWVQFELQSTKLSERDFAEKVGVTYNAVQKWRKKQIKQGLLSDSIAAIARYRGESPKQTRAWFDTEL